MLARDAVLVAGLAPPEPPNLREARARCPLCFDGGKVHRSVSLSLLGEGRSDLGTYPCGRIFSLAECGGDFIDFGPLRGALCVQPVGSLFPPFRLTLKFQSF